jgi:hypothetical protein
MDRRAFVRRRALAAMSAHPQCFRGLLAGHVGSANFSQLLGAGLTLGWQMMIS